MKSVFTFVFLTFVLGMTAFRPAPETVKPTKHFYSGEYNAQLVSTQGTGANYEWVWTVTNPNPGNGTNGTLQNLSHWSLAISDRITLNDIVEVAYSTDGQTWISLPVSLAIDKSQECYLGTVLKFDYGTSGGAPTWYKLVVNKDFPTGYSTANFKSGSKTGCYNSDVMGIGTPVDDTNSGR
jgi:hypothetical protein